MVCERCVPCSLEVCDVLSEAGQGPVENKYVPPQRRADGMNVDIRTQYAPPRFGENENLFC